MSTRIDAFVCDFCPRKKRFASRTGANRHEKRCFHNPIRRACASCKYLHIDRYDQESQEGGPWCDFDLIPIAETPEEPARAFTFNCDKWEPKALFAVGER